uniref:Protein kinase domain-containing protein n=1 Tax=Steinernema glaseri TaxID=37863 RepID=A0A1I7Y7R4_9BILA
MLACMTGQLSVYNLFRTGNIFSFLIRAVENSEFRDVRFEFRTALVLILEFSDVQSEMLREEVFVYRVSRTPVPRFQYWNRKKQALFWEEDHRGIVKKPYIILSVIFCNTDIISYEISKAAGKKLHEQILVPPYYSDSLRVNGLVGSEKFGLVKVVKEDQKQALLKHAGKVMLCTLKVQAEDFVEQHGLIFAVHEVRMPLTVYFLSEEMNRIMPWNKYAGRINPETGSFDFLHTPEGANMFKQSYVHPKFIKSRREFWERVADVAYDPIIIEHMENEHKELENVLRKYQSRLAPR